MIYILSFGRADSRILGVFTSEKAVESAKARIIHAQIHPSASLFVEAYPENELVVESDMLI